MDNRNLLAVGAGAAALYYFTRPSGAQSLVFTENGAHLESMPPPVTVPVIPATPPAGTSSDPRVSYAPGKRSVNSIQGFRRATNAEAQASPELMSNVRSYLQYSVGEVFFRTFDGKRWALALEDHAGGKKGVSAFIGTGSDTGALDESESFRKNTQMVVFLGIGYFTYKLFS